MKNKVILELWENEIVYLRIKKSSGVGGPSREQILNEIAVKYELNPVMVSRWKAEFLQQHIESRKNMVERDNKVIPLKRQAELFSLNRTSLYRPSKEHRESEENVNLMHLIDQIFMEHSYFGYRHMEAFSRDQGHFVNRIRVRRLMYLMGLEAIYPKPNLSKRLHAKYTRTYLLRGLKINRPNQVCGIDITYLRMGKGFMYCSILLTGTAEKSLTMNCPAH